MPLKEERKRVKIERIERAFQSKIARTIEKSQADFARATLDEVKSQLSQYQNNQSVVERQLDFQDVMIMQKVTNRRMANRAKSQHINRSPSPNDPDISPRSPKHPLPDNASQPDASDGVLERQELTNFLISFRNIDPKGGE
jgi:hypothetical protein